ncbi:MAG: hypothetical protein ACK4TN_03495, partial [Brevinematales bacterium]
LDFSASELPPAGAFTVDFLWKKGIQTELTNQNWDVSVYYSSNLIDMAMMSYGEQRQQIVNVPVKFYAAVSPNKVNKDLSYQQYVITITNDSEEGSAITLLKILPPTTNTNNYKEILTNIVGINSSRIGNNVVYSNDGVIYLPYQNYGISVKRGEVDTIVLTAYDRENSSYLSGSRALEWTLLAANAEWDLATNKAEKNLILWTNDLSLEFVVPPYKTVYAITPTNISTVDITNTITFALQNTSESTEDVIDRIRISIPWPFLTNVVSFSSTKASGYNVITVDGTNYLEVVYPVGRMGSGSNDVITVIWRDNYEHGETNVNVDISVRYATSGSTYVPALPQIGATNTIFFTMPAPVVSMGLPVFETYTTLGKGTVSLMITNKGYGNNTITKIDLYVPDGFTNGLTLDSLNISSAVAITNTNFVAPNHYVLFVDGFVTNETMQISLDVTNLYTNTVYGVIWNAVFDNTFRTTNVNIVAHVVDPGSAELLEREVYSDKKTHSLTLKVYHNTPGTLPLQRIKIVPNAFFYTNISSVISTKGTVSNLTPTECWIVYSPSLAKGSVDEITMVLYDGTNQLITNNLEWKVYADNGTGLSVLREKSVGALKQATLISRPEITNILWTSWYTIPGNDRIADFRVTLSNRSADEVIVISNTISLPAELTNITP